MNFRRDIPAIDWVCFSLLIIGAINWGILGIAEINLLEALITAIFQPEAGNMIVRIIYALVGLAGVYFFYPLYRMSQVQETGTSRPS